MDIEKRIIDEVGCDLTVAQRLAQQLAEVHDDLQPVAAAWCSGNETGYDLNGITIEMIMQKGNYKYIQALLIMNGLLENPERASEYSEIEFISEDMEEYE